MKRTIFFLVLSILFAVRLKSQVTKDLLKGVWEIVAMGKVGNDTVIILNRDSLIMNLYSNHVYTNVGDLINAANTPAEKMAYSILGMFSNMFLQFDSTKIYGEGMQPETEDQKPSVKRGTYTLEGPQLTTKIKKTETSFLVYRDGYMVMTTETGSVMYLRKFSDVLY